MLYWFLYVICYLPIKILYPTKIIGKKNLPKGKAIYACNHQSMSDIFPLYIGFGKKVACLGKKELFKNKFLAWFFKKIGVIPVNRKEPELSSIKQTLSVLKDKNRPVLIFPQGTRKSSAEELEGLKNGVAMFGLKTNSPIIPMVLVKKPRLFRFNKLVIGEPLDLTEFNVEKPSKELFEKIGNKITAEMERLLQENTKVKKAGK